MKLESIKGTPVLPGYEVTRQVVDGTTKEVLIEGQGVLLAIQTDGYSGIRVLGPAKPKMIKRWKAEIIKPNSEEPGLLVGIFDDRWAADEYFSKLEIEERFTRLTEVEVPEEEEA